MKLTVASSPHIRGNFRTNRIMLDVVLSLLPGLLVGIAQFGPRAIVVTLLSMATAVASVQSLILQNLKVKQNL